MSPSASPEVRVSERLKRSVVSHYEAQLHRHGPTARGMDWKDEASQRLRFELLCGVGELAGASLYEVGAGAGHLYGYLAEREVASDYTGCDLSSEMVQAARGLNPDGSFEVRDILVDPPGRSYDFVVTSGLFHVRLDHSDAEWREFVFEILRRMYALCDRAIAFNLMTDQVDFRSDRLYYANPGEVIEFCRSELSRRVTLRHDYPLYEFTTYVYRD